MLKDDHFNDWFREAKDGLRSHLRLHPQSIQTTV
jgi:hypothetical protein